MGEGQFTPAPFPYRQPRQRLAHVRTAQTMNCLPAIVLGPGQQQSKSINHTLHSLLMFTPTLPRVNPTFLQSNIFKFNPQISPSHTAQSNAVPVCLLYPFLTEDEIFHPLSSSSYHISSPSSFSLPFLPPSLPPTLLPLLLIYIYSLSCHFQFP